MKTFDFQTTTMSKLIFLIIVITLVATEEDTVDCSTCPNSASLVDVPTLAKSREHIRQIIPPYVMKLAHDPNLLLECSILVYSGCPEKTSYILQRVKDAKDREATAIKEGGKGILATSLNLFASFYGTAAMVLQLTRNCILTKTIQKQCGDLVEQMAHTSLAKKTWMDFGKASNQLFSPPIMLYVRTVLSNLSFAEEGLHQKLTEMHGEAKQKYTTPAKTSWFLQTIHRKVLQVAKDQWNQGCSKFREGITNLCDGCIEDDDARGLYCRSDEYECPTTEDVPAVPVFT